MESTDKCWKLLKETRDTCIAWKHLSKSILVTAVVLAHIPEHPSSGKQGFIPLPLNVDRISWLTPIAQSFLDYQNDFLGILFLGHEDIWTQYPMQHAAGFG